ncbi:MAG: RNA polymerase sigma factor [Candidatus Polarisedimenticolia bacterium]
MPYRADSIEGRLIAGDDAAVAQVIRWIAQVMASPRFWTLRAEWLDLHQDAMARVLESLSRERFDPAQDFRTYVQAVARYTAFEAMTLRRRAAATGETDAAAADTVPDRRPWPEESAASVQIARLALDRASAECRALIRAYFFEQRNYAEIAATLGVPVGTVKSRLARCLEKIQRLLTAPGPGRAAEPES